MKAYEIEIQDFNSSGILATARSTGTTHMRHLGAGFAVPGDCNSLINFYALPHKNGYEYRVADTNGDPLWEECDPQAFADIANQCGVAI